MDRITKLIRDLLRDRVIWFHTYKRQQKTIEERTRFTSNFLSNVADVYDRHGIGTTELFLLNRGQRETANQANALLRVLKHFKNYPEVTTARGKGRLIIKNLDSLHKLEELRNGQ